MATRRYYESEHDLRQVRDLLMAARAAIDDAPCMARYPHIGVATFRFFMVASHLDPYEYVRLWHNRQGRLVAYALLGEDPSFGCEVAPAYGGTRLFVAQQYSRQQPSRETLAETATDWDGLQPVLWRGWLRRLVKQCPRLPWAKRGSRRDMSIQMR